MKYNCIVIKTIYIYIYILAVNNNYTLIKQIYNDEQ